MRPFIIATLTTSIAACAFLGVSAFRRARAKGRYYAFPALFLGAGVYTAAYSVELLQSDLRGIFAVLPFEYLGVSVLTVSMVFVIRDFKGGPPTSVARVLLVSLLPAVTVLLAATSSGHGMLYINPSVDLEGVFTLFRYRRGPWYYIHLAFSYGIFLYGLWVFISARRSPNAARRAQAGHMFTGTLVPIAANVLYIAGATPAGIDLTPIAFTVSGLFYSMGFFKYRLFDIHPIARDTVFEHMREAAVVIDEEGAIIDHNRAARELFPRLAAIGASPPLSALFQDCPDLEAAMSRNEDRDTVALRRGDSGELRFETKRSVIRGGDGRTVGILLLLYDVTERERMQQKLTELASLDELTRIHNRRYFYELAAVELERARRHGRPIGFAVMDMNGFKRINDRYGHGAGDEALRLTARLCADALRSGDVVGRVGGDEFAFVFPECDEAGAAAAVEKLRAIVSRATFTSGQATITLSAAFGSVGSAGPVHPDLEELLTLADRRMYADKPGAIAARARTRAAAR